EAGQTLKRLDFFVTNVAADGSDKMNVDGTTISLTDGNIGTTATNSLSFTVNKPGSTATVSLTKNPTGVSEAAMASVVNSIAYLNTNVSPAFVVHNVTISRLDDSGLGTSPNSNSNTSLSISSNVTVSPDTTQTTDFFRSNVVVSGDWT